MNWFAPIRRALSTSAKVAPAAVTPLALPYTRLTLDSWCASPERVAYVAELLRTPLFLDLLGMLSSVRVSHRGALDPTTAAFLFGQRVGRELVLDQLLAAGTAPPVPPTDLPADYGAENALAAWEREGDA